MYNTIQEHCQTTHRAFPWHGITFRIQRAQPSHHFRRGRSVLLHINWLSNARLCHLFGSDLVWKVSSNCERDYCSPPNMRQGRRWSKTIFKDEFASNRPHGASAKGQQERIKRGVNKDLKFFRRYVTKLQPAKCASLGSFSACT